MTKERLQAIDELCEVIVKIDNRKDCEKFLYDLLTMGELEALSQRLSVAKMLIEGERFSTIQEKTGASSATISRVNRAIKYGDGGYKLYIKESNK